MHRLVCIGDSLSQGFKSGSILETNISYPAIIAREMGIKVEDFRHPYFDGEGGLPINIEYLLRQLDQTFGKDINLQLPLAIIKLRKWMDRIEDYWERGPGSKPLKYSGHYHNLAVWGFEMQDAYQITARFCKDKTEKASDNWIMQVPERPMLRTALRVLNPSHSTETADADATQISRATQMAREEGGIENLIVFLGANNALPTVLALDSTESVEADLSEVDPNKRNAKIYKPEHYEELLDNLMAEIDKMNSNGGSVGKVFWGTVPFVSIAPVSHGVGGRMDSDEGQPSPYENDDPKWFRRYFRFYTRPWIPEKDFNQNEDDRLTGKEVMKIDWIIAQYRKILTNKIKRHNRRREGEGKEADWFIVDINRLLERMAHRRYEENKSVPPPPNWSRYEMPEAYRDLKLDTRFLKAKQGKRIEGGVFSLDGVHPTTVGYGLAAQEFINVMQKAGVKFYRGNGKAPRDEPVMVDYKRLVVRDSLIENLPFTLDDIWDKVRDIDQIADIFTRAIRALG